MKISHRKLNELELIETAIEDAKKQGKRVLAITLTPAEYGRLKSQARNTFNAAEMISLERSRPTIFGLVININKDAGSEEPVGD